MSRTEREELDLVIAALPEGAAFEQHPEGLHIRYASTVPDPAFELVDGEEIPLPLIPGDLEKVADFAARLNLY